MSNTKQADLMFDSIMLALYPSKLIWVLFLVLL